MQGAQSPRFGQKEKTLRAAEQDRADVAEQRASWHADLAGVALERLVFIDGTGIDTRMTRAHGRAARGRRWGRCLGALAALTAIVRYPWTGGPSRASQRHEHDGFLGLRLAVLAPAFARARPVVVLDNLAAHKAERVRAALDAAGLGCRYLPPYSPDFNPIEQAWSKLKARLRTEGARSREALETALGPALATISPQDAQGWFRLCGYEAAN